MEKSREQLIETAKKSLREAKSSTSVKGWVFQLEKKNYVILKFRNVFDFVEVYESTKQGRKVGTAPILSLKNSTDVERALEETLQILIPNI